MYIFPAIDLYDGKAVRLFKGDYARMTVYSDNPIEIARDFEAKGAAFIHMVDLEGARDGSTPNLRIVADVAQNTSLFVEIGGGIRDMATVKAYLSVGVSRVILGTAAVTDEDFLRDAVAAYGEKIAGQASIITVWIAQDPSSGRIARAVFQRTSGFAPSVGLPSHLLILSRSWTVRPAIVW